jgi:hypothetical protein
MNRFAFDGEINLILSLDLISDIYVGFFFVKLIIFGFREMDLGETSFLDGGVANKFLADVDILSEFIFFYFILLNLIYIDKFKSN